jgi:hypothetical protein
MRTSVFLILLLLAGCATPTPGSDHILPADSVKSDVLQQIADHNTPDEAISSLLSGLDSVEYKNDTLLISIMNDSNYSEYRRGMCALFFIQRHVQQGMTLNDMISATGPMSWIKRENITVPGTGGGNWKLPEGVWGEGRAYRIQLFPELQDTVLYLNVPERNLNFQLGLPPTNMDSLARFFQSADTAMEIGRTKILALL